MPKKIQYFYIVLFIFLVQHNLIISQDTDITGLMDISDNFNTYLTTFLNNGVYSTSLNSYHYQISYVEKQTGSNNGIIFPQIKISDNCINKLKEGHTEQIVVAKVFSKVGDSLNTLAGIDITDVIYYEFFYLNAANTPALTKINIQSACGEKVVYYLPIYSSDTLKNKFVSVSGQNPVCEWTKS